MTRPLHIGLLVNPIAGLGGEAALKGSDTDWRRALDEGYGPHAQERAQRLVDAVEESGSEVRWLTLGGAMGVPGLPTVAGAQYVLGETTADDTVRGARAMRAADIDLLVFVGGDGTAADVARAIGHEVACLGLPGGVKITSPVFAHDIPEAAWLLSHLDPGFDTVARDVTDLDEDAYRAGRLDTRLMGSLLTPVSPLVQGGKVATTGDTPLEGLVEHALRDWDRGALHIVGAGSVCHAIKKRFWGEPTLLGFDVIEGDRITAADCDARDLEARAQRAVAAGKDVHIHVSIIGGQGVLIGRGTQVLTPKVLRSAGWQQIHVVAPPEKLLGLRGLVVDSGDPEFDAAAPKYLRIISGRNETRMCRVNAPPKDSS